MRIRDTGVLALSPFSPFSPFSPVKPYFNAIRKQRAQTRTKKIMMTAKEKCPKGCFSSTDN